MFKWSREEELIWIVSSLIGLAIFVVVQPMYPVFFTVGTVTTIGGLITIACNIVGMVHEIGNRAPTEQIMGRLVTTCAWAVLVLVCLTLILVGVYGPDHPSTLILR